MLPDHAGGNEKTLAAGVTFTGGNVAGDLATAGEGAAIVAHENVLQRLSDAKVPFKALPTETYFGKQMKLSHFFNGEGIRLSHFAGVTDGDSVVLFSVRPMSSAQANFLARKLSADRFTARRQACRGSLKG